MIETLQMMSNHVATPAASDETTSRRQSWHQAERDLPLRREMIRRLIALLESTAPSMQSAKAGAAVTTTTTTTAQPADARQFDNDWQRRIYLARHAEACLYQEASSLEDYCDWNTLQDRLRLLKRKLTEMQEKDNSTHLKLITPDQNEDPQPESGHMSRPQSTELASLDNSSQEAMPSEVPTVAASAKVAGLKGSHDDFSNDWHQPDKDLPYRREMIQRLVSLLYTPMKVSTARVAASAFATQPATRAADTRRLQIKDWKEQNRPDRLFHMAQQIEVCLYREAPSLQVYFDWTTLRQRLRRIAHQVSLVRQQKAIIKTASV